MKCWKLPCRKLILIAAVLAAAGYTLSMLRVYRLRRTPRTANRRPVNRTAPVYRTTDFYRLERMLATEQLNLAQPQISLEALYFKLIGQQHLECPFYQRVGDAAEGGWDVCFTPPFDIGAARPACQTFSFGVDHIFAYDDELADKYGCQVRMFDPSMTGVVSHRRRRNSWFYSIGLSSNNSVLKNGWHMRTLCSLVEELSGPSDAIDIVKLDIEHWEWESLEAALRDGCLTRVKQLMFESHTSEILYQDSDYAKLLKVFLGLLRIGFRSWRSDENPMSTYFHSRHSGVYRACCYEHYMLNTRFLSSG